MVLALRSAWDYCGYSPLWWSNIYQFWAVPLECMDVWHSLLAVRSLAVCFVFSFCPKRRVKVLKKFWECWKAPVESRESKCISMFRCWFIMIIQTVKLSEFIVSQCIELHYFLSKENKKILLRKHRSLNSTTTSRSHPNPIPKLKTNIRVWYSTLDHFI